MPIMKAYKKRDQVYPSDLSDAQWEQIKPLFCGLREYTWPKRELVNAVLYFVKSGCQWRLLPHDFPPYSTVHSFYRRARLSGLWDTVLQHLVSKTREDAGRKPGPTYALIDSQSVKTVAAGEQRGIDGGKKRKATSATSSWTPWATCSP
jgi:transposase